MPLIDAKAVQDKAKQEIAEEAVKDATSKLKELYRKQEKARLVLKNIDREIQSYLEEMSELSVYESAGVDTNGGGGTK